MRASELRHKSPEELQTMERELSEQVFALRLQKVTGQLRNPSKLRELKREIARVLTVANEKQREKHAAEAR